MNTALINTQVEITISDTTLIKVGMLFLVLFLAFFFIKSRLG